MKRVGHERRQASWRARIAAVIALLGTAGVLAALVAGSIGDGDSGASDRDERRGRTVAGCTPSEPDALRAGYYVVQPGEPGLSAVADRTCVPVERLQRLNENLDPQAIPQGACVNLRRDGCKALG